jgi:predicted ATP-dependent serine protease
MLNTLVFVIRALRGTQICSACARHIAKTWIRCPHCAAWHASEHVDVLAGQESADAGSIWRSVPQPRRARLEPSRVRRHSDPRDMYSGRLLTSGEPSARARPVAARYL